ncbi:hypothetical protein RN001_012951 [Aquatica leii]|uniref:Ribosomal protein L1 n=1 Tax=Aquatica leii TaxID=1421715 RepID=A0AAN7P3N8_9COLE|nr:hypothetical protein RN001_012951 [Aquatica leii]
MAKTQVIRKKLKSNIKGKILKKKIVKPTVDTKNKLKELTVAELKQKLKFEKPRQQQKPKLRPKNKLAEEDKPKKNYVLLPKQKVDDKQVQQGVAAFYELLEKSPKKPELFDEDQPIFLQVSPVKVPETPIRHIRFHLKHTLVTASSEICLIVKDKGKRRDYESTIEHYENILSEKGITNIKTIMPFYQFKHEYGSQFELKRKLLNLYDHFLVDSPVNGYVTSLLGSRFYESRKMPSTVKMNAKNLKGHFEHALAKTIMKVHSKGDSYAVQIGHTGMSQKEIVENVIQIVEEMDNLFPGGFDNVRSLGIKSNDSILIPIYLTLKNNNTVELPVCKPVLPKRYITVKDSLSTYLNADVTVTPEGDVILKKHRIDNIDVSPELSMNDDDDEDSVEDDDEQVDDNEEAESDQKEADESNDEESEQDNDDLAKEEEMYLNHYEHEQEEKDEKTVKNKRRSKQTKPTKKVKINK